MDPRSIIFLLTLSSFAYGWDNEQLEVFDVVEEVKVNFYELLNIEQNATNSNIKSAFRKLSIKLHPDKSKEDTTEQFRNLVSVYEVLKDQNKRKYYDEVLANGLPNWRSAVYYYRHYRKMGMVEMFIILFVIITIGQYLMAWASYAENTYNAKQATRKKQKDYARIYLENLPRPSFYNTLPVQIPVLLFKMVIGIPSMLQYFKHKAAEKVEEVLTKQPEEEEIEEVVEKKKTVRRRKPGFVPPEGPTFEVHSIGGDVSENNKTTSMTSASPPVSGGFWTDDDLADLIKLVKKYPGGTPERWERIAEALSRSVPEVTFMANKMKNNAFKLPSAEEEEDSIEQPRVKEKTRGGKLGNNPTGDQAASNWNQTQQKALEDALAAYPKGAGDRWDRIADCVPEKTKEECMLRYKYLVETIKKQKEQEQEQV